MGKARPPRAVALFAATLSVLVGGAGLFGFLLFLYVGSFGIIELSLGMGEALALDSALSLAFFAQHSGMIRQATRRALRRWMPEHQFGAAFSIASGLVLSAVVLLWQESGPALIAADGAVRSLLRACFFLGVAGILWSFLSLKSFDTFGLRPIRLALDGRQPRPVEIELRGAYRWVRHPQYAFILVMIWCYPALTPDRLLFNLLWSAWLVVGTRLEERDLIAEHGKVYRDYQKQVPMLLPFRVGRF